MDRHQSLDSLQFDDHQVIDHKIEAICGIDQNTSIADWKRNLRLDFNPLLLSS
jgi:hypothetical protein